MKKNILYLSSDTGGGHKASALAIMDAVEQLSGKDKVNQYLVDVFAECSKFLNLFARLYGPVIKYSPSMWGAMYYWLNDWKKLEMLEKISRPFIVQELKKLIKKRNPSCIVSVHPMVNHLTISTLKELGWNTPVITTVLDPISVHRAWVDPQVDLLIVATEEAKKTCIKHGMHKQKIKKIGLPVHPRFSKQYGGIKKLRKEMDLNPSTFTVLLMGGGEGTGKMFDYVKEIANTDLPIQLIVISGKNEQLKDDLDKLAKQSKMPMKIFGFTREVPSIMSASNLIITKAGPGTIAESLAMNLPMIITSWLPGQEEGNVEYVIKEKVGKVAKEPKEAVEVLTEMKGSEEYKKMKKRIAKIRKPKAVFDIAKIILEYCD